MPNESSHHSPRAPRSGRASKVGLYLGPLLFLAVLFLDLEPGRPQVTRMAAVAVLMAVWWITEAIPLFATALLPMILYPLLGIQSGKATAPIYVNSTIFLFLGGFMIALCMERWNLHRRIALAVIAAVGGGPARLVFGFMAAAAFLSMWISNTATAVMMVPIGLAIVIRMEEEFGADTARPFAVSVMLGIAYAASVGGMTTLVGTPPNLSFARIYEISFPGAPPVEFGQWMIMGVCLLGLMLPIIWFVLTQWLFRAPPGLSIDRTVVDEERRRLGPIAWEERWVLAVFIATALLWVFRKDLSLGLIVLPGWSRMLPHPGLIDDGTIAITMALTLFLVPVRSPGTERRSVMGRDVAMRLPWHIVLLFGGGFALAHGFRETGLSDLIGRQFAGMTEVPIPLMVGTVSGCITFLTELTSNTATTEMILPILASVATAIGIHPLMLMVPATLSASCAFMMPVATPPNAIIFGSGRVRISEMARAGIVLNLVGIVMIGIVFWTVGRVVLGVHGGTP